VEIFGQTFKLGEVQFRVSRVLGLGLEIVLGYTLDSTADSWHAERLCENANHISL